MDEKNRIRTDIWRKMERLDIARFPRPVFHRIPNFVGSRQAAELLRSVAVYKRAKNLKINPDSPQRYVRYYALRDNKNVLMPTPRLRGGFLFLDPNSIPRDKLFEASTIRGAYKFGIEIDPGNLKDYIDAIDLIVEGSVAVDLVGGRLGKGEGYGDKEYSLLEKYGLADSCTPIVTTVHEIQIVDFELPQETHDIKVGLIITPHNLYITKYGRLQEEKCGFNYI